jgi:hypothetical protein
MHPKVARALLPLLALLVGLLSLPARASDGSLLLGFRWQDGQLAQTSLSRLDTAPRQASSPRPGWTALAERDGKPLWRWNVPAPRRFHPGSAQGDEFVVLLPQAPPGTRLTLLDQQSRPLWSTTLDAAALKAAEQRAERTEARLGAKRHASDRLTGPAAGSPLARQLAAQRVLPSRSDPAFNDQVPLRADQAATAPTSAHPALPLQPPAELWLRDRQPLAQAKATEVAIQVRDELGAAPGQSFAVFLFRDGSVVANAFVDAEGHAELPLEAGVSYRIDFHPAPPLVHAQAHFSYTGSPPLFTLERGWLLDLRFEDASGALRGEFDTGAIGTPVPEGYRWFPGYATGPGQLRFALPRDPAATFQLWANSNSPEQPSISHTLGPLSGDQALTLSLARAERIEGRVQASDGAALPAGGSINCSGPGGTVGPRYLAAASLADDGRFALPLPLDTELLCNLSLPQPLLSFHVYRTLQSGQFLALEALRGVPVRFLLEDDSGAPLLGDYSGEWYDVPAQVGGNCSGSPCAMLLPSDRPIEVRFHFSDPRYRPLALPAMQYLEGDQQVVVPRLRVAGGRVRDGEENARFVRVRAFDAEGRFIVSERSNAAGEYAFRLPSGSYRFEADANAEFVYAESPWFYRLPHSSALTALDDQPLPDLQLPADRGVLVLEVDRPCGFEDQGVRLALDTPDGQRIEQLVFQRHELPPLARPPGQCASRHELGLSPGTYQVEVAPLGWPVQRVEVPITADASAEFALDFPAAARSAVWRGRVQDEAGQPLPDIALLLFDADQQHTASATTNGQGRFELPFVPGWTAELLVFDRGDTPLLRQSVRLGASPPDTITLDRIVFDRRSEAGLQRLYGDGDRARRFNILFVAEGYTDLAETYTDLNGNGIWDGVVWYDFDGNGRFDAHADIAATYGNATYPEDGSFPGADNEPFTDLNGDGVLSLDDPALFVANAEAFMRSLLGADVWQEHRDAFNAYLLFQPSAQAGHDIRAVDGSLQLARDTVYDGALQRGRFTLEVDRARLLEDALAVLPEVDVAVVLINQPIMLGRANVQIAQPGVMVYYGGPAQTDANGIVQSHEMGHFVGGLCDEYGEFPGIHGAFDTPYEFGCSNASPQVELERLPWAGLLPDLQAALPSRHRNGSLGLFEGADYYHSGAYRPTLNSTMRFNSTLFNAPSREALLAAIAARQRDPNWVFHSGFEAGGAIAVGGGQH